MGSGRGGLVVLRARERNALGLWAWPWRPRAWHKQVEGAQAWRQAAGEAAEASSLVPGSRCPALWT